MVEFGEQLRKAREEKGMTQQTLAEQLFVTRQAVSKWECGERYPDLPTTKKISEALDVSLDDLLSGKDMNKVIERNSIVDNNLAEKLIFAVYAIFLLRCFGIVRHDIFLFMFIKDTELYRFFDLDSFFKEQTTLTMLPWIVFFALTLFLVYGFIRVAKGTLSPKVIGMIGIMTFIASSLTNVTQILSIKIIPLIFEKIYEHNYSINIVNSVIIPNLVILILTVLPAVIGSVASFFYFIRGNNKIVWKIIFILMAVSEIVIVLKFISYWERTYFNLPTYEQKDFCDQLKMLEAIDSSKQAFYIEVFVFLLFQAIALWIKKARIKSTPKADTTPVAKTNEA